MAHPLPNADAWADFLIARGPELRRGGVLSIGVDGYSATLAEAGPDLADGEDDKAPPDADEPINHWENPNNYPTGVVPTYDVDNDLPDIPSFPGDG